MRLDYQESRWRVEGGGGYGDYFGNLQNSYLQSVVKEFWAS
jgi:hypothetical protein